MKTTDMMEGRIESEEEESQRQRSDSINGFALIRLSKGERSDGQLEKEGQEEEANEVFESVNQSECEWRYGRSVVDYSSQGLFSRNSLM